VKELLFSSVFLTFFKIFNPEVTLIHDQVLINVGAYDLLKCNKSNSENDVRKRLKLLKKIWFE